MNDLPFVDIPPNVQHLTRARDGKGLEEDTNETSMDEFEFTSNPFSHTISRTMRVCDRDSSFGFELGTDKLTDRAYVAEVKQKSSAEKLFSSRKATRNKIRGAYFVRIDNERVFTEDNVVRILKRLFDEQVKEFNIEFAP